MGHEKIIKFFQILPKISHRKLQDFFFLTSFRTIYFFLQNVATGNKKKTAPKKVKWLYPYDEVYMIQLYVIKFVCSFWQVSGFFQILFYTQQIKLLAQYNLDVFLKLA